MFNVRTPIFALALVILAAACGGGAVSAPQRAAEDPPAEVDDSADAPVDAPAPAPPDESPRLADGSHQGRIAQITTSHVSLELMRVLSGEEARTAAEADGVDVGEGLPNDFYIQDLGETVTVPIAGDAGVRIIDCSTECREAGVTLGALTSGEAKPFGGPSAPVEVVVKQGRIVSLAEIYLP